MVFACIAVLTSRFQAVKPPLRTLGRSQRDQGREEIPRGDAAARVSALIPLLLREPFPAHPKPGLLPPSRAPAPGSAAVPSRTHSPIPRLQLILPCEELTCWS